MKGEYLHGKYERECLIYRSIFYITYLATTIYTIQISCTQDTIFFLSTKSKFALKILEMVWRFDMTEFKPNLQ